MSYEEILNEKLKELVNKSMEDMKKIIERNNSKIERKSDLLEEIQEYGLKNQHLTVEQILKDFNISRYQYHNLIQTGLSITQIRKLKFGKSQGTTEKNKNKLCKALQAKAEKRKMKQKDENDTV